VTRALALFCAYMAIGLGAGMLIAATLPMAFGMRPFTVLSGSMEPALDTGDMVVDRQIAPADARPGDIVTFKDPQGQGRMLTHRLRTVSISAGTARMTTKGDANDTTESWTVPANGTIGRVAYRLPMLGYALSVTHGRNGKLLFIVLPALLFGVLELARIWRPRREAETDVVPA
jgi:signal peptidase